MLRHSILVRGLIAGALFLVLAEPVCGQGRLPAGRQSGDSLFVMLSGTRAGSLATIPSRGRGRSVRRNLTAQEKNTLIQQAFPNGLPKLPKVKATQDPTGLSKPVVLDAGQLVDPAGNARLMVADGILRPRWQSDSGLVAVNAGGHFVLYYRPAKVGQPILIECSLSTSETTKLEIKPYSQTAAVPKTVSLYDDETIAFVVLPTTLDEPPHADNRVRIVPETQTIVVNECGVTPLS